MPCREVQRHSEKNLKDSPRKSKEAAYCGLVRSSLEYGSTIWDSHLKKDVANLEKVNRRALRFVMNTTNIKVVYPQS